MSLVWKRLQRYNKRAAKFRFTIAYHELELECDPCVKALPKKLHVMWTRRGRKLESSVQSWLPTLTNPFKGSASWPTTEMQEITVTLFRDPRSEAYDDKDWKIVVEEVSDGGKRRPLASSEVNVNKYVTGAMTQQEECIHLKPLTKKVKTCSVSLTICSLFLKEGQATDDDMMSLASMMSTVPSDIARLEDVLDEEEGPSSTSETAFPTPSPNMGGELSAISSLTSQMNNLVADLRFERSVDEPTSKSRDNSGQPVEGYSIKSRVSPEKDSGRGDRSALKPLELKTVNGSPHQPPNNNNNRPLSRVLERQNTLETPSQDLLSWAQDVTRGYRGVRVTNMTTSWRNGMAFCAVFHKFRPDMIDFDSLVPTDIKSNCRIAFDAGDKLGIPKVIEPADMVFLAVPDKLAVMTYLHQVKAHFMGEELRVKSIVDKTARFEVGKSTSSTALLQTQTSMNESEEKSRPSSSTRRSGEEKSRSSSTKRREADKSRPSSNTGRSDGPPTVVEIPVPSSALPTSPTSPDSNTGEEKGFAKFSAKFFKVGRKKKSASPSSSVPAASPPKEINVTEGRGQLAGAGDAVLLPSPPPRSQTAPNGFTSPASSPVHRPSEGKLDNRTEEMKELPSDKPMTREEQLRERARKLMAEAKKSSSVDHLSTRAASEPSPFVRSFVKPKTPSSAVSATVVDKRKSPEKKILNPRTSLRKYKNKQISSSSENKAPGPRDEPIAPVVASDPPVPIEAARNGPNLNASDVKPVQPIKLSSFDSSGARTESPVAPLSVRRQPSREALLEENWGEAIPAPPPGLRKSLYIQRETDAIDLEQARIDHHMSRLEEKVRLAMKRSEEGDDVATEEEDELLCKWFKLINEKSALLRRQMQLNVMEKEDNLERRVEMLNQELREMFSMDETMKTDHEREREQALLDELVELVNARDQLVTQMDLENLRMDEEQEIAADVSRASFRTRGGQPLPGMPTGSGNTTFASGAATLPRAAGAAKSLLGVKGANAEEDKNCVIQ